MNSNSNSNSNFDAAQYDPSLEREHSNAVHCFMDWQDILEIFYQNPWFQKVLDVSVGSAMRRRGLGGCDRDDINQEVMVAFVRLLQRDASLGFDASRGSYRTFLAMLVHRCCYKAIRKYRVSSTLQIDDELLPPIYDEQLQLERMIDFCQLAKQIPEPYRSTVRQVCQGLTVPQIALKRKRSERTIYRWVNQAIELLQEQCAVGMEERHV